VDDFGGWPSLDTKVFGDEGVFTKAFAESGQ
jgi:ABC-type sulfate transport system substrate-binding protein